MLLTPIASQAQIYKCINNGNTVFSDQPEKQRCRLAGGLYR
ncbi:DUF4124 domain-containing protein [Thalassotalea sp. G20_0]|nr:DUF4124 domain-containing protein [Thalassotalea sp. G20_0]